MKFVRLGTQHLINLDRVTAMHESTSDGGQPCVVVEFAGEFTRYFGEDRAVLLRFMVDQDSMEDLHTEHENARCLEVLNKVYDPFADIGSLFTLFNALPNREELRLVLDSFEIGHIERKDDGSMIVDWESYLEGLDVIAVYLHSLSEPVE